MRDMVQNFENTGRKGGTLRPTHETMPAVTLFCSVRGLPSASTHSPTRIPELLPSFTVGSGSSASIFTSARSEALHTIHLS